MPFKYSNTSLSKKHKPSKKKSLSDYNLYVKEASSQSEDDVETESLTSDYTPDSVRPQQPQHLLKSRCETPDSYICSETTNGKWELADGASREGDEGTVIIQQKQNNGDNCSDETTVDFETSQLHLEHQNNPRFVSTLTDIKTTKLVREKQRNNGQVFSPAQSESEQERKEEEEEEEEEEGNKIISPFHYDYNDCEKNVALKRNHVRRGKQFEGNTNEKDEEAEEEIESQLFLHDKKKETNKRSEGHISSKHIRSTKNSLSKTISTTKTPTTNFVIDNTSTRATNTISCDDNLNYNTLKKKQKKEISFSKKPRTKKDKYTRHFGNRAMMVSEPTLTNGLTTDVNGGEETSSSALRADQFNKISPSPFDEVPGFQRSNTMQHHGSKKRSSPRLSKSLSFDSNFSSVTTAKTTTTTTTTKSTETNKIKAIVKTTATAATATIAIGREKWIQFEEEEKRNTRTGTFSHPLSSSEAETIPHKTRSLNQQKAEFENDPPNMSSNFCNSNENLVFVEPTTPPGITQQQHQPGSNNISTEKDCNQLLREDDEWSEISDEIISLEFDTDEEKFRDTPVKLYPNVSLFQVPHQQQTDGGGDSTINICSRKSPNIQRELDHGPNNVLFDYPPVVTRNSWKFWYRYPDKKKKMGGRKWVPVLVRVDNGFLKINSLNGNAPEIRKEILLHQYCDVTTPVVHNGNKDGKVHSVKFQYVKFKEHRHVKPRLKIEHVANFTPIVKLSCRDMVALNDFISCIETAIKNVPIYRGKDISYEHEEIFIDCFDKCSYLVSGDGQVLKYNITVQIRLRCFLCGEPEVKLFLNDTKNEGILSRTKEALSKDVLRRPSTEWISPDKYEYHSSVDVDKSSGEGGVVFTPPDACTFELLRFRLRKRHPPPITIKSSLEVSGLNSVHLKAEVRVNGNAKSIRHKRNNVVLYIPVPSSWSKLFVKSRLSFGRNLKYLNVNTSSRSHGTARDTNNRATFEISAGCARYEPAYGAIVWELGNLPILRDGLPADASHTFQCSIELPFPLHIKDNFQPYSYLEFSVKQPIGSNVSVEELFLSDGRVPEKWVFYRSDFMYRIEMKILEDGKERTS